MQNQAAKPDYKMHSRFDAETDLDAGALALQPLTMARRRLGFILWSYQMPFHTGRFG